MIWWLIGIGAVVGLIIAIFDGDCYFLGTFCGAIVGLVAAFILCCIFSAIICDTPTTTYESNSYELVALNDDADTSISGLFFLGTGSLSTDENLEYTFIYETPKGMTVGTRRVNSVYIQYIEEGENPRLVRYVSKYDNQFWNWLLGNCDRWEVFYVPQGSITTNFNIDLQ
jgi:uncharacterized membrane protein YeaQ/YmgE (transglycosylase-associated protein family)